MPPSASSAWLPLVAAVICGLAAGLASLRIRRGLPEDSRLPRRLAWALAVAYAVIFVVWGLGRFYGLGQWGTDLGMFGSTVYNTAHGRFLVNTRHGYEICNDHCSLLLFAFAPFAYVFHEPVYLPVIIALSAAATVALLYHLASARAGAWPALALSLSLALSPFLHGAALCRNPVRATAAVLMLAALLSFAKRRFWWGVLFSFLAATASEVIAVYAVGVAAFGTWVCRMRWKGVLVILVMAAYAVGIGFYAYPKVALHSRYNPHFVQYIERLQDGGLGTLFETKGSILLSTRLWYGVTILAPIALFLLFAGPALITLLAPAYVFLTHYNPALVRIGAAHAFQFLPLAYAAAAFGLARLSALRNVKWRRFLLAGGCAAAVVFQVAAIALPYRAWYRGLIRAAIPSYQRIATLAGIRKIPPDVAVSVDERAYVFVAHRPLATTFPHGLGLDHLKKVKAVFLERDCHNVRLFPSDMARLRAAGFWPTEVTRDYAYFTRGRGELSYEDVWEAWWGVINDSQFHGSDGYRRSRRDARAPYDGAVRRFERGAFLYDYKQYFFPPGDYKFRFIVACDEGEFCRVKAVIKLCLLRNWQRRRKVVADWTVPADGYYHCRAVRFSIQKPRGIRIGILSNGPFYLDAVAVESEGYNLAAAARYCPWPFVPCETAGGP
jgi:uncharacterized membrane protein